MIAKLPYRVSSLPLAKLVAGGNDRTVFAPAELEELAASIKADGLAQPITVRPIAGGRFEIVAGERRSRACRLLGWTAIPAIVRKLDDESAAAITLAENSARVDLHPLDEARAYRSRMDRFGWTAAETAKRAKVSGGRVTARLLLLDLVEEAQQMIAVGQMAASYGEVMAPLDHNRQRIALRALVATERMPLRVWRSVVGELLAQQAQDSLFNAEDFMTGVIVAPARAALRRRFPVAENVPPMPVKMTLGATFEHYLADLMTSENASHRDLAGIVGALYESLLKGNMAKPPTSSPLDTAAAA